MNIIKKIFNNTGKPEGFFGKMMVNSMNSGHAKVSDWGISNFPDIKPERIVDLGCGGGRNTKVFLKKYPDAHVTAMDYSDISVAATEKLNNEEIQNGRCKVIEGNVKNIPLPDKEFNLATAFETIYFWPNLEKCFKEVYRILKHDSYFIITNEADGETDKDKNWENTIDNMKIYKIDEICAMLKNAGFTSVSVRRMEKNSWVSFIAHKL